uniref:Uncharacterized protein n=1 Tax=Arundo donax TaxID=35708 RepID=A0A0A9EVC3_ARUDO
MLGPEGLDEPSVASGIWQGTEAEQRMAASRSRLIEEQQRIGWPANWRQLTAGVRRGEAGQGSRQRGRQGTVEVEARQRTGGGRRRA